MYFEKMRLLGSSTVDLPIVGAQPTDSYICKGVDGLGPPEIDAFLIQGTYQGRDVHDRQVVALIGLNPDYSADETPEQLRGALYSMLSPGPSDAILLQLMVDTDVIAQTEGYVVRVVPALFDKEPVVQMTINCPGSYLEAWSTEDSLDEFDASTVTLLNNGEVTTGFRATIDLNPSIGDTFRMQRTTGSLDLLHIYYGFEPGDQLTIDTREGRRELTLLRSAGEIDLIGYLSADSEWLQLYPGSNEFDWAGYAFVEDISAFHLPLYWGV